MTSPEASPAAAALGSRWATLVPPGAAVATVDLAAPARSLRPLAPAEAEAVTGASDGRVHAYRAGRHCAAAVLGTLGRPDAGVPRGVGGAPRWPGGVVGSVTHDRRHAAAVAARAGTVAGIGIDAESDRELGPGVARRVATPAELAAAGAVERGALVLFCAKESVYKAWSPLTGVPLGFLDVEVALEAGGRLAVGFRHGAHRALVRRLGRFEGRFAVNGGSVLTVVTVATGPGPGSEAVSPPRP